MGAVMGCMVGYGGVGYGVGVWGTGMGQWFRGGGKLCVEGEGKGYIRMG